MDMEVRPRKVGPRWYRNYFIDNTHVIKFFIESQIDDPRILTKVAKKSKNRTPYEGV
jgi:hypothetical protein